MEEKPKIISTYFDIKSAENEETLYFFLEHLLKARIDLHMETGASGYDQEVNIYVANLLRSILTDHYDFVHKPYVSPFDIDVQSYIKEHPGLRNEYLVYKDNADFGLLYDTVFLGFHHDGSYHNRVMADGDIKPRIAQYYVLAASALGHLRGMHETLVQVLYTLGQHLKEMAAIIRKAAGDYFDFIERLSAGTLYHLQKGIQCSMDPAQYRNKVDRFLSLFKEFKENASAEIKEKLCAVLQEIKQINPSFGFNESML